MRNIQTLATSQGLMLAVLGIIMLLAGLLLLVVSEPLAVAVMIIGGLGVFIGMVLTLRNTSESSSHGQGRSR